jgi:L,D-transpeptidase ErfK/SrfK
MIRKVQTDPALKARHPLWRVFHVCLWMVGGPLASAASFDLPGDGGSVVGTIQVVAAQREDTLVAIARRYNLGYNELRLANPEVDPWLPGEGTPVVLPTQFVLPDAPRKGIVINVPEMRLYYYLNPARGETPQVVTYPISVGRRDWNTPLGRARVTSKDKDPTWYPPKSIRAEHAANDNPLEAVVPPGPDNPLGGHALRLSIAGYLIHGTNKPAGIGMQVTHGCIRLFPEDIENLYQEVPVGTPVRIVNQPYKTGWRAGELYLEVHPPLGDKDTDQPVDLTPVVRRLIAVAQQRPEIRLDWAKASNLAAAPTGIPGSVSLATQTLAAPNDHKGGIPGMGPRMENSRAARGKRKIKLNPAPAMVRPGGDAGLG